MSLKTYFTSIIPEVQSNSKLTKRFIEGLKHYNLTLEEIQDWKYCGGNEKPHLNYFMLCFPGKKIPQLVDRCICGVKIVENCYITNTNFTENFTVRTYKNIIEEAPLGAVASAKLKQQEAPLQQDLLLIIGNCCIKKFIKNKTRTCEKCGIEHRNRKDNRCNLCRLLKKCERCSIECVNTRCDNCILFSNCSKCNKEISSKYKICYSCYTNR